MKFTRLIFFIYLCSILAIAGCGGGGSSVDSSESAEIGGKIIDGYVSGATVFLDLDFDGVKGSTEPSTTSKEGGDYRLIVTGNSKKCIGFAPVVVDVPVGAIDEENGVVQKPYKMALPPDFEIITETDIMDVSPLTTILWSTIEANIDNNFSELTCENLLESQSRLQTVKQILEASISDTVTAHNISEDQIFGDYVTEEDSAAHQKAQEIVRVLERSFEETLELREEYPDANTARITYRLLPISITGDPRTEAWFRNKVLSTASGGISSLERMNDDLSYVEDVSIYNESQYYWFDDFFISESTKIGRRLSDYSCEKVEKISNYTPYSLYNVINDTVSSPEECQISEFEGFADTRHVFVESFSDEDADYRSQFVFYRDGADDFPGISYWFDFKENHEYFSGEDLENYVLNLPYQFDANDAHMGESDLWIKTKNYTEGNNQINLVKYSNGTLVRTTTYVDGTWLKECSSDAVNWGECQSDCCPSVSIR